VLNTLQYLIVDEILLARIMEQDKPAWHATYRDEEQTEDTEEDLLDEDTEYDANKGRPILA
jgi:hypothetical protein